MLGGFAPLAEFFRRLVALNVSLIWRNSNEDFAEAHNNLGIAYNASGKTEEAISSFRKAIEINPNHVKAHYNLSVAYFNEKQYKLAIKYCDKAKDLGFVNPDFLEALKPYRE